MTWNVGKVRQALVDKAKEMGLHMPQMQSLLAQERFLARLASIPEGEKYVWKGGGLVLRLYQGLDIPRYTVDVDLLAKGISIEETQRVFKKAFAVDLDDGFRFLDIVAAPMERETPYGGERLEISWTMFGKAQSAALRVDVCTGDVVDDVSVAAKDFFIYPEGVGALGIHVYPAEFIFAEKLETMFRLGTGNTRLKDLIDMWGLARQGLDVVALEKAVQACFANRKQQFDLVALSAILMDADYIRLMGEAKMRNFPDHQLPEVQEMAQTILDTASALSL